MLLNRALLRSLATAALVVAASEVAAQGLSPLRREGETPGDRKAFYISVKNPYPKALTFRLEPMELDHQNLAPNAWVHPNKVTIAPNRGRRVTLIMEIPKNETERTISLCVTIPSLESAVLPRVCGTYTGRRFGAGRHDRSVSAQPAKWTGRTGSD